MDLIQKGAGYRPFFLVKIECETMRVTFKTLGCRLNEAETELWAEKFVERGFELVADNQPCELVVINTCAVTKDAEKKSQHVIRKIRRENPNTKVVISGCYATLDKTNVQKHLEVDLVVENKEKHRIVELAETILDKLITDKMVGILNHEQSLLGRGKQRAFIKVQDGCRYKCAFCIVTVARGEERSTGIGEIIKRINKLSEAGIQEIVLTGVHLGGWGSDIGLSLDVLIESVLEKTDIARIRLGSLEPWELSEGFFRQFENPRLMPHLHLPLQSGSDEVLKRMSRRCRTGDFEKLVTQLRAIKPGLNITSDIIVGFPGETDEQWIAGYEFVKRQGFGNIHVFPFSPREGTRAAIMNEQVSEDIKKARCAGMRNLAEEGKFQFNRSQIGLSTKVLWEEGVFLDGKWRNNGYTENYVKVFTDSCPEMNLTNRITKAIINSLGEDNSVHAVIEGS